MPHLVVVAPGKFPTAASFECYFDDSVAPVVLLLP